MPHSQLLTYIKKEMMRKKKLFDRGKNKVRTDKHQNAK